MMGMAAGIASTGKRVFVYSIGNFPTLRCLEQIRNDVCLMNTSVVVVSVGAGYAYGPQGSGAIPPNSVLDFDIELVDVQN